MTKRLGKMAAILMGASLLGACAGIREHRGFVLDEQLSEAVQVGVDNRESVAKTLGRPTFTGQFGEQDWYYVSSDTNQFAFRNPRIADHTVLHIQFDAAGNVAAVNKTDEKLIAAVDPMGGKTPTLGRQRSFFDELFGNIGSINQPGLPGGSQGQ